MTGSSGRPTGHYLLGHDERELRRLDLQGALYRDVTLRAFTEAGIGPGMRILDIGCGSGDVSEPAVDTVATRLREETVASGGTLVVWPVVYAFSSRSGPPHTR